MNNIYSLEFINKIYWQLVEDTEDLPYKTTIFFEMFDVGDVGIRIFEFIWFLVAVGYIIAVIGLIAQRNNLIRK